MSNRTAHHAKSEERSARPSRRQVLWTLGSAVLGTLGGWLAWRAARSAAPKPGTTAIDDQPLLERRPTLESTTFTGKARRAYEVARQMPAVLDRLKCYCRCDPYGHRTLLSCYTDNHAST